MTLKEAKEIIKNIIRDWAIRKAQEKREEKAS
jgi:hypothetical protein